MICVEGESKCQVRSWIRGRVHVGLWGQPGIQEASRGMDSMSDRRGPELTCTEQGIQTAVALIKPGFVRVSHSEDQGCDRPALVRELSRVSGYPGNLPLQVTLATAGVMRAKDQA